MKNLLPYFHIIRPLNVFISAMVIVFSALITKFDGSPNLIIFSIFVIICYTAGANSLNDVIDYKADKLNKPNRPIASGDISRDYGLISSIIFFSIGTFVAFKLNHNSQIISIFIALPLMVLYNIKLKKYPLVGNIVVSLVLALSFIFSGYVFSNLTPMIIPSCLAFGLTLIGEIVKDIEDIKGDKVEGLKTFPIIYGKRNAIKLSVFLSIVLGLIAFVFFIFGYYNIYYGIFLILTVEIPLAVVVISLSNKPNIITAKKSAKLLKFCTIGGLFSIYIGTL